MRLGRAHSKSPPSGSVPLPVKTATLRKVVEFMIHHTDERLPKIEKVRCGRTVG